MKYHYQIVSSFDPTDVYEDSKIHYPEGFDGLQEAKDYGLQKIDFERLEGDQYYVKVIPED